MNGEKLHERVNRQTDTTQDSPGSRVVDVAQYFGLGLAVRRAMDVLPFIGSGLPESSIEIDDAFHSLANERRRYVVKALDAYDPIDLGPLACAISAMELGKDAAEVTANERKRVYVALIQGHLETLDDCGIVEYDERQKRVSKGPEFDAADWMIKQVQQLSDGGE